MNWISRAPTNSFAAGPQFFGGVNCQEHAGVAQRFGARRFIKLGEIDDGACAGESIGNDCLAPVAQLEGDDERWSVQLHGAPKISVTRRTKPRRICLFDRSPRLLKWHNGDWEAA